MLFVIDGVVNDVVWKGGDWYEMMLFMWGLVFEFGDFFG